MESHVSSRPERALHIEVSRVGKISNEVVVVTPSLSSVIKVVFPLLTVMI